jgi:hypothetical protein
MLVPVPKGNRENKKTAFSIVRAIRTGMVLEWSQMILNGSSSLSSLMCYWIGEHFPKSKSIFFLQIVPFPL